MKQIGSFLLLLIFISCSNNQKTEEPMGSDDVVKSDSSSIPTYTPTDGIDIEALSGEIDLNMNIDQLSLSDIRILRNSFAAKQGYCFMKADLRAVFSTTTWYNDRMEERFWNEMEENSNSEISYSSAEKSFIERLEKKEKELLAQNFKGTDKNQKANLNNIVNLFQLEEADPKLMEKLGENGFAVVPNTHIQLFHLYEENDYAQFPNFITTDMFMQLFHMYFGYVLRKAEEDQFIPALDNLSEQLSIEMNKIAKDAQDATVRHLAKMNATYYAIGNSVLTGGKFAVDGDYLEFYNEEIKNINEASDANSSFLNYTTVEFPYSLFKPRGHYTRNEQLQRYFKAMMWLQTAPFCLDDDDQFKRAILNASLFAKNDPNYKAELLTEYERIMEPVSFMIGEPDNVSFMNLAKEMTTQNLTAQDLLSNNDKFVSFRKSIKKIADSQNTIRPKEAASCIDKINFMPQRYLADNEILQELVDLDNQTTKRGYPNGLDVMAAFGSESAEDILMNELKEGENWKKYPNLLKELKTKMKSTNWEATVYNKWISSLLDLQKQNDDYPYFMQTKAWDKKDLNASLASWAELKHDAILYAEQPMGAECGGGGPPDPYTLGYVEPNIAYWNAAIELIDLTEKILKKHKIMTKEIQYNSDQLRENAVFLKNTSEKELKGETLTEQEYRQIELMGSTFEWITLGLVKQKDEYLESWDNVSGADKSVAVVADVYTANASNNPEKGVMHVATGNVNDIYVVVEIEGYLYLTKGAVFAYHEFNLPLGNRLTDEEWQEMLEKNEAHDVPNWVKSIMVPIDAPKNNEKVFYSSGC